MSLLNHLQKNARIKSLIELLSDRNAVLELKCLIYKR